MSFLRLLLRPVYPIYQWKLIHEVRKTRIPEHIAIIMDGNRRYAQKLKIPPHYGHKFGSITAEKLLEWCLELGVKNLTVYAFSTENLSRSEEERESLFELMKVKLEELKRDPRIHKNEVKVRIIGELELLPEDLQVMAREVEKATARYNKFRLNIAIAYGGRQEILSSVRKIAHLVKEGKLTPEKIDSKIISKYFYETDKCYSKVDLLIRTGGEQRLSNFLPWQANGSESVVHFCDIYWPEFRKIDLLRAIRAYQERIRDLNRENELRHAEIGRYIHKNVRFQNLPET